MDLQDIRNDIDKIDQQLIQLFAKRMNTVEEIVNYKKENNIPILNRDRENEIIEQHTAKMGSSLKPYAIEFLESILKISKEYQIELMDR